METLVFNRQSELTLNLDSVSPVVENFLKVEHQVCDEVSVYFITTEEIQTLHAQFFNDPSPTDCISFPLDGPEIKGYRILGEIFICPKTAIDYILKNKEKDVYKEITLYLVHGLLHLIGYDDIEDKDRKQMRSKEKLHMDQLLEKQLFIR